MPIVICENCGAKYSYEEQHIQMRDKDSEECQICHHTLMQWNGGVNCYNFQLIESSSNVNLSGDTQNS